jgi:hypothetical protein
MIVGSYLPRKYKRSTNFRRQSLGIRFLVPYFFCCKCWIPICQPCSLEHDQSHKNRAMMFKAVRWQKQMGYLEETLQCKRCRTNVQCRLECSQCDFAICRRCINRQGFKLHKALRHAGDAKTWYLLRPPHWRVLGQTKGIDCLCKESQAVSHCERSNIGQYGTLKLRHTLLTRSSHSGWRSRF